jgi:hypothetical protein
MGVMSKMQGTVREKLLPLKLNPCGKRCLVNNSLHSMTISIEVLSSHATFIEDIPPGVKENVYFIINNNSNIERKERGVRTDSGTIVVCGLAVWRDLRNILFEGSRRKSHLGRRNCAFDTKRKQGNEKIYKYYSTHDRIKGMFSMTKYCSTL